MYFLQYCTNVFEVGANINFRAFFCTKIAIRPRQTVQMYSRVNAQAISLCIFLCNMDPAMLNSLLNLQYCTHVYAMGYIYI